MPFPDLQSFVAELDKRDELRRISAEVDPILEITEIADRVMKSPSPQGHAGTPPTDPARIGIAARDLATNRRRHFELLRDFGSA